MVRRDLLLTAVLGALGVSAVAVEKRQSSNSSAATTLTDGQILNFALVLEHLESTFYAQALSKYDASAFQSAGFPNTTRSQIAVIAADEAQHVSFLTTALSAAGATPVSACNYTFPYTDVSSFLAVSQVLEGVGVSAYLGAASLISNKAYLTAAGSILTAEARHSAYIRYINGQTPFVTEDTPLTPTAVTSLAAPFFASCPNGSAPPFKPFPAANLTSTQANIGNTINIALAASATNGSSTLYCTILSGLQQAVSTYSNGSCTIPSTNVTTGQAYGLITKTRGFTSDADVVAGPFVLQLSNGTNPGRSSASGGSIGSAAAAASTGAAGKNAVAGISMALVAVGSALLL